MSRITDYIIDFENARNSFFEICRLIDDLDIDKLSVFEKSKLRKFERFLNALSVDFNSSNNSITLDLLNYINNYIIPLEIDIDLYSRNIESNLFEKMDMAIKAFKWPKIEDSEKKAINSISFYETKIADLKIKEAELEEALKLTEGKSKKDVEEAKRELEDANRKILEYKNELELKRKLEDARENWKDSINNTFKELKTYLKPIKKEQNRLDVLFWVYLIFSVLLVIAVIAIEWIGVFKISSTTGFPDFKQYITVYLPLPIAGALLWGFIYQMNRAQRQLVVIAKSIHKVEYIQGLLLSINKLSPTIEDGISRINAAIDSLIKNHLGQKEIDTEEDLIKEESKDSLPIDAVIKLLKEMKGISKKE